MMNVAAIILHTVVMFLCGFLGALWFTGGGYGLWAVLGFIVGAGLYWFVIVAMLFVWLMITKELEDDNDGL